MTLPPDPDGMNDVRASCAEHALTHFIGATGVDHDTALADLLCDLMHLCDRDSDLLGSFEEQLDRARGFYREETAS